MAKGHFTRKNIWDKAADLEVRRGGEKLDPGVNYFVLMLDQMEMTTYFSCEGHPGGFYIMFEGPYEAAFLIRQAGFFSVEIEGRNYWSVRQHIQHDSEKQKVDSMRWAAEAWERHFGPLDFDQVELEK